MDQPARETHKLHQIEGLRGYLALCVLLSHVVATTGYDRPAGAFMYLIRMSGPLAVQCFMIISGFVIFLLIDTRKEPYRQYITRRFFRIFPVYILLFLLAIFTFAAWEKVYLKSSELGWFTPQETHSFANNTAVLWSNLWLHIPLHLTMLHGIMPSAVLPDSSTAFLGPAWSLSLEWQFYLLAPVWYCLATSKALWKQALMYIVILFSILGSKRFLPAIDQGAALPFFVEYFYCGAVFYFLYKKLAVQKNLGPVLFPAVFILCTMLFKASGKALELLPIIVWALLFALIIEPPQSIWSRYVSPIFSNQFSVWIGKISFSIYLSHPLVIIASKWLLLSAWPDLSQINHLLALGVMTTIGTLLFSALLYYFIEAPFIKFGASISNRLAIQKP